MEEVKVSVICATYNQKTYISRCLRSLVSQKTNFKYEIIVHDDASNDGTANIVKEYADKYPDLIIPILQSENQYSQHKNYISEYVNPLVKGKYRAYCEGDDFWCDDQKLQRQFDVMEANPQCSLCVHSTKCVDDDEREVEKAFPKICFDEGIISTQKVINSFPEWSFQLSSFFIREVDYQKIYTLNKELFRSFHVGDIRILYCMALFGDYYYLKKVMSAYTVKAQNSWTTRQNEGTLNNFCNKMITMSNLYIEYIQKNRPEIDVMNIQRNVIPYYEFYGHIYRKEYKDLLNKKYRKFLGKLNMKFKIKVYLISVFPFLKGFLERKN